MLLKIILYGVGTIVLLAMLAPYILEKLRRSSGENNSAGVADLTLAFHNEKAREQFTSHYKKSLAEGGGAIKVKETQRPTPAQIRSKVKETLFPGVKLGQPVKVSATLSPQNTHLSSSRETMISHNNNMPPIPNTRPPAQTPADNIKLPAPSIAQDKTAISSARDVSLPSNLVVNSIPAQSGSPARPIYYQSPNTNAVSPSSEVAKPIHNINTSLGGSVQVNSGQNFSLQQPLVRRVGKDSISKPNTANFDNQEVGKTHPPQPWISDGILDTDSYKEGLNSAPTVALPSQIPTQTIDINSANTTSTSYVQISESSTPEQNISHHTSSHLGSNNIPIHTQSKISQDDIQTMALAQNNILEPQLEQNISQSPLINSPQNTLEQEETKLPPALNALQLSRDQQQEPHLVIKRILAPIIVEQGERDQAITIVVSNPTSYTINIAQTNLRFYQNDRDISTEYQVRASANNPPIVPAGGTEEIRLTVDILESANLGKTSLVPIIMATPDGNSLHAAEITSARISQWRVEPCGRIFKITTEHQNMETAGIPFQITLETFLNNEIDIHYQGQHRVFFSMLNLSNDTAAQIPTYLDLTFKDGKTISERCFCFYNTVETYILSCQDNKAGGPEGSSANIMLAPGVLSSFRLEIHSPQKNNVALEGENILTALDLYSNVKSDYRSDTILACSEGSIKGLPNNSIPGTSFQQGIVDLNTLNLRICVPEFHPDGKVVRLTARGSEKSGSSGKITILPATAMSVSATQAMIHRLWAYRRHHIWIANADTDTTKELELAFQNDYDVLIRNISCSQLDIIFSNPPDALFLDVENVSEDGYQIIRELRKSPNMECLPIFVMGSTTESEAKIGEVLRCGCIYTTKPLSMPALRAMLADLLQNLSVEQGHMPSRGTRLPGSEGLFYQIVSKIGEGGMGYIYEAIRQRDQKRVIIKYLPTRDFKNIKSVLRFIQEAHTVLGFHHENLVQGYDMLMDRNRCFYVMEFIEGKTVEQLIRQENKMKPERATRIILQITRALQCLQEEHDLVHRDIKPSNILVMPNGLAKLVDFGIAKISNHHLTTVGIILGTPYYLSPEQILGKEITIQSDIYSLGATFYHMVTGEHPFQGTDVYAIIHQRLSRDPRDPRQYNIALPRTIAQIILRMMHQNPNKRYESPKILIDDLEKVLKAFDAGNLPMEADRPLTNE